MASQTKYKILIADDEVLLTNSLRSILTRYGYDVSVCYRGADVLPLISSFQPDALLLDIFLGDMNGIELMKRIKEEREDLPVVMVTANSDVTMAVRAMKEGALDYVVKPFDLDILDSIIKKAIEIAAMRSSFRPAVAAKKSSFITSIIAVSDEMKEVLRMAAHFAKSSSTTVLVQGESGTGKELVSRAIHNLSARTNGPFISVNCGAIPRELAESEFFGYERGAFTGATEKLKQGKFELANTGTLLLDEIGELNFEMQVKLLRVLEEKCFYRLGGTKEIEVDVRVVASSNRDLLHEVETGRFREDLYYRLNVATILIPPLRQRKSDIIPIAETFIKEFSQKFSKGVYTLSEEVKTFLQNYTWRGNVRELRNAIERVILLNPAGELFSFHFTSFLKLGNNGVVVYTPPAIRHEPSPVALQPEVKEAEKSYQMETVMRDTILKALEQTGGNQVKAAQLLGLTRAKLRYRIEQLNIDLAQVKLR